MEYPIEHRIAQINITGTHVDLGAQDARAVLKFAGAHAPKQIEIFVHRTLAKRAVGAGLGQRAAGGAHLFVALIVDIGIAGADQVFGPVVELREIVRRMIEILAPIEAQPAHVALDRVDKFLVFLGRIGVVIAQVAVPAEFVGDAKIEADRFGVADVKVAVRLRRKPRHRGLVPAGSEIGAHDVADEVLTRFAREVFSNRHFTSHL